MKTIVIAQHHGTFLTLNSLKDRGIEDVTIIIPGSQVEKYNKMYSENASKADYQAFKDYDKLILSYIKTNNLNYKAYVVDNFDVRNSLISTLKVIMDLGYNEIVACILSGAIVNNDYTNHVKDALGFKTYGLCYSRVYNNDNQLSMYHMIGLPQHDSSFDLNFFVVDVTKVQALDLEKTDSQLLSDAAKKKNITVLGREFNGKDDPLIGTAISARQTIGHNLKIQSGFIVNLWNKSIKTNDSLRSEEVYGYPFNLYSKYTDNLDSFLPGTTLNKIRINGKETEKLTSGLYGCLDIIDL
jgi:hypothetical protein